MFCSPALDGGLPLESEWHPITPGLLYSYWYSGRSKNCCFQDGYDFFSELPVSPVFLPWIWGLFQEHHLKLVSLPLSYSTKHFSLASSKYFSVFIFHYLVHWICKIHEIINSLFCPAQAAGAVEYSKRIFAEEYCPHSNVYHWYNTKQSDVEAPVMLELRGIRCPSLLPWFLSPILPGVVAPDRVLSMGPLEVLDI